MDFRPFDPAQATDEDFRAIYEFGVVRSAVDWPELTPPTYEGTVGRLRTSAVGAEPETMWLAEDGGKLVATGRFKIELEENTHLATITIAVSPEQRRQGIGTAFLKVLLAEARAVGRTRVMGPHVRVGSGGEPWAERMGFVPAQTYVMQTLTVADTDPALWDVPVPDGYRLVAWTGAAPEDIIASYARARHAIADALKGDLSWTDPDWTPERIRKEEADFLATEREHRVVVAVDEATGEVVAQTQIFVRLARPEEALQSDTSVTREHRGHGLGRALKAAMMRGLVADRPGLATVETQTADIANMARINLEVGYRTVVTYRYVEAEVAELEKALGMS